MKLQFLLDLAVLGLVANACLLSGELDGPAGRLPGRASLRSDRLERRLARVPGRHLPTKRQLNATFVEFPIGKEDRFNSGQYAPRGLGTDDRDLGSILNVGEVESGLQGLANAFDDIQLFTAPYPTFEERLLHGATVGTPRVLVMGGIHARERGAPDAALYLVSDLLAARAAGTGVRYGNRSYSAEQVRTALSAGVAVLPLVNPDGVAHDQATGSCWRKNRNPANASAGDGDSVGVDLNRNFDVLWDFRRLFSPLAPVANAGYDDPASEVFQGPAPLSEPETRNVAWVLKRLGGSVSWLADLHTIAGGVFYAWGGDYAQSTDPWQNFANASYDGLRGHVGVDPPDCRYREFIEEADLSIQRAVARRMCAAMSQLAPPDLPYEAMPIASLYVVGGSALDHALGQYYSRRCGAPRVHGLAVEFGEPTDNDACPFYPDAAAYHRWLREVAVGLVELLLAAAGEDGEPKVYKC